MFALLKAKINMYKNAIVSVIVVMALAGVYFKGRHDVNVEWKLEKAEIAAENAKKKAAAEKPKEEKDYTKKLEEKQIKKTKWWEHFKLMTPQEYRAQKY